MDFEKVGVVHYALDDLADVVGLAGIVRHDLVEFRVFQGHGLARGSARGFAQVVAGQEGQQLPGMGEGRQIAGRNEVGDD